MRFIDTIVKRSDSKNQHLVRKNWGYELWIINNENYCFKKLHFNEGAKASLHSHLIKHESWYIVGTFKFRTVSPITGEIQDTILDTGDQVILRPGILHQLEALEESDIFEASTHHEDSDTYRIKID